VPEYATFIRQRPGGYYCWFPCHFYTSEFLHSKNSIKPLKQRQP